MYETLWTGAGSGLLMSVLEKLNLFHLTGLIILVLLMGKWMDLFLRKSLHLRCQGWLSLENWIGALTTSIASRKIGALIRSMKFLSPGVALYLYKSAIQPCMEYCCRVWAGAPSWYLEFLDKLQKRICRTVSPSLTTSIEPSSSKCSQFKSFL